MIAGSPVKIAPGLIGGLYPENADERLGAFDDWRQTLERRLQSLRGGIASYRDDLEQVNRLVSLYAILGEAQLRETSFSLRRKLSSKGLTKALRIQSIALVSESIYRCTGMRAYDNQLLAAFVMLDGRLAEMATGEGKSLSTVLAAGTSALAGTPTHVLTANDYLVARDGQQAGDMLKRLGLSVGWTVTGQDAATRRQQYRCDITYSTAREVVFDYLKDQRVRTRTQRSLIDRAARFQTQHDESRQTLLRGLCFALVDEADSIFLDEATTPLLLSRPGKSAVAETDYRVAIKLAKTFDEGLHYETAETGRGFELTTVGETRLQQVTASLGGLWNVNRFRCFLVTQALSALHEYHRGRDYVIRDDKVEIVDPTTGRIAEGRQWTNGLHQLLEIKEDCEVSDQNETIAQITYQTFFPRYLKLGGTSATISEASQELLAIYGLHSVVIPRHKASQFRSLGLKVYIDADKRWEAVIQSTRKKLHRGQPVLIGTDSINASQEISAALRRAGIEHRVLTADQSTEEATIIAAAGSRGRVTVTTNMAGRGTDIKIDTAVRQAGGLHVINCQLNGSARIDRQLLGRSARQGDPGSGETLLALDDLMYRRHLPITLHRSVKRLFSRSLTLPPALARALTTRVRFQAEMSQREARRQLREKDKQMRDWLALSGAGE